MAGSSQNKIQARLYHWTNSPSSARTERGVIHPLTSSSSSFSSLWSWTGCYLPHSASGCWDWTRGAICLFLFEGLACNGQGGSLSSTVCLGSRNAVLLWADHSTQSHQHETHWQVKHFTGPWRVPGRWKVLVLCPDPFFRKGSGHETRKVPGPWEDLGD